ncbi:MAG: 1-acyl-sn-glycerol-3-phosphate acyltransferase [Firmicutes bacterium]|nr:1-acyl-sn-glycerol-3-phosphate acyltransferase [Bacillota bacterium]
MKHAFSLQKDHRPDDQKKAKESWIKHRHEVVYFFGRPVIRLLCWLLYRIKVDRLPSDRSYLILFNHQTPFDQFFPVLSYKKPIYFITSEDIMSNGWISRLLTFLVAPIPIKKQVTDLRAVLNAMKVAKEGGTIALAPEGNRTYAGRTVAINPAIAKLAKKLGLPIVLYRLEGGYGLHPRWSDVRRKALLRPHMEARVVRVIEPKEAKAMSDADMLEAIQDGLFQDDQVYVQNNGQRYDHPKAAEYVERLLYVCPRCGLSAFRSRGKAFRCLHCGSIWRMEPDLSISLTRAERNGSRRRMAAPGLAVPGQNTGSSEREDTLYFPLPDNIADWFEAQQNFIRHLDLESLAKDQPLYEDKADLFEVILYDKKVPLCSQANIRLYPDRIEICQGMENAAGKLEGSSVSGSGSAHGIQPTDATPYTAATGVQSTDAALSADAPKNQLSAPIILPFTELTAASVLGRNKLNLYTKDKIYQLKGSKRFNAVKYVNLFFHAKNQKTGEDHEQFLGL